MPEEDIWRRIEAHGDKLRDHEAAIAVLDQRAKSSDDERRKLWEKKDSLQDKLEQLRHEMNQQHQEVMQAVTANRAAASVLSGERGAGKWIAGFIATVILVIAGLGGLILQVVRWFSSG